ncbi:hypothetical protein KEM54_002705 [Ascosphaera aggregata]|nr:hypothetical protein KEM54_002705 [Ascosphaera aggregata]
MSSDINLDLSQMSSRLPSPPPVPEVQINSFSQNVKELQSSSLSEGSTGGTGLSASLASSLQSQSGSESHSSGESLHDGIAAESHRLRPGTKVADMAAGPPLIPLSQLDSPFQLQEYLKALYHSYTHPKDTDTLFPITYDIALRLAQPPDGADWLLWLYELCRLLTIKINNLIIAFFSQRPPCSTNTCPEMRAAEWQYLCAVHEPPKSCCAIDYCCHTLDWATNILTSPKFFPSRLTLGSESSGGKQVPMRHLTNIFRRVYRIFAHAWFQHREAFWEVENSEGLYIFFKTVCDVYNLMPEDSYTIPLETTMTATMTRDMQTRPSSQGNEDQQGKKLTILRKIAKRDEKSPAERRDLRPIDIGATARRHRQSPSRGSSVGTIVEASEDDEFRDENAVRVGSPLSRQANNTLESRGSREASPFSQLRYRITATARRKSGEKRNHKRKGIQKEKEDKTEKDSEQDKEEETEKMKNQEREQEQEEQEEQQQNEEPTVLPLPVHINGQSETEVELATKAESQDITDVTPASTAAREQTSPRDTTTETSSEQLKFEEKDSEERLVPEAESSSNNESTDEGPPSDCDPVDIADQRKQDEPPDTPSHRGTNEKKEEEEAKVAEEDLTGMPQFLPETL